MMYVVFYPPLPGGLEGLGIWAFSPIAGGALRLLAKGLSASHQPTSWLLACWLTCETICDKWKDKMLFKYWILWKETYLSFFMYLSQLLRYCHFEGNKYSKYQMTQYLVCIVCGGHIYIQSSWLIMCDNSRAVMGGGSAAH